MAKLLEIINLTVHYGKALALDNVSLDIEQGEIISIVGANGAGKTTVIRAISGLKVPTSGEIWFKGKRIDGIPPYDLVKMGIVQIPAGRQIFATMSVLDNLQVGAHLRRDREAIRTDLEDVYRHFPILRERRKQAGGQLSGGEQQMLAVGRALMAGPVLLLMDEPSVGLSPMLVAEVGEIIKDINSRGISILLVEQNCRMALQLAERAYVLAIGRMGLQGNSKELMDSPEIQQRYMGG